ncbi:hypothetical protein BH23ACT10_BH23ACT10_12350 [soil metagenome]
MSAVDVCASTHDVADHAVVDVLDDERQARDPVGRSPQRGEEPDLGWSATAVGRLCERSTMDTLDGALVGGLLAADQHTIEYDRHPSGHAANQRHQ